MEKLYIFTEQELKELLNEYATNIFMDIQNADKNTTINLINLYPAFPEPIELPDLDKLRELYPLRDMNNTFLDYNMSKREGANHIINLIKNKVK